ncbi:MAG: tRNA (adenosine(37)-N6)-threonylcarbamoyltransferase complex dimerization subunit type 1 TsaB [Chitinophagaceae bacterium]
MSKILQIDTANSLAAVSLSNEGKLLAVLESEDQKNHASFLQTAIQKMLMEQQMNLNELDAVAVVAGPGSYTGLRVGLASAKGICYAIQKPIICINTLDYLAASAIHQIDPLKENSNTLFCPMMDARRMEVYTALYDNQLNKLIEPMALILQSECFIEFLNMKKILFFGNGSRKWKNICDHSNAHLSEVAFQPFVLSEIAYQYYIKNLFSNLAYCEPTYLKDFFDTSAKH